MGDIILTTPVVRCLKQQVEGAEIHYLTKPQYTFLLDKNPYIDKIHSLGSFAKTLAALRNEGFDYIIDLHNNIRSLRFKRRLKVLDFSVRKLNFEKWLLTAFKINRLPQLHIVDRYFETVSLFDAKNDGKGLDYFVEDRYLTDVHQIFESLEKPYIVIAIGGQHQTKKLPAKQIAELCRLLRHPNVLIGGPEDLETANEATKLLHSDKTLNACGLLSVDESALLIKHACVVITHDTGMMHIAAAFKKIVFSVWGNTIPQFGMSPYMAHEQSQLFEVQGLKCRPCSKLGYRSCPKKHFKCMTLQNIKAIALEANKIGYQC